MDWRNERWVKLYTRDSPNWCLLSWKARGLFCLLLRAAGRDGVIDLGSSEPGDHRDPLAGLAALLRMPREELADPLSELSTSGTITAVTARVTLPKFVEAQETPLSDAERARGYRERKRLESGQSSRSVTQRHAPSPTEQNRVEQNRVEETPTTLVAAVAAPSKEQLAFDAWNQLAHPSLPRATKLTGGRRRKIKAALDLVALDGWPKAIAAVNAWPWALGENPSGWKATLDWFIANDGNGAPNIVRAAENTFPHGGGKFEPGKRLHAIIPDAERKAGFGKL
jgi:hypothetical protein